MSVRTQGAEDGGGISTEHESLKGPGAVTVTKLVDLPPKPERQDQRKTMVKRIVTISVVLLGLSIVLSHADKIIDRSTTPSGKLPPQSVVSALLHFGF